MKYFKLITSALVLGLIGLFIYQNLESLLAPVHFSLNLYIQESAQWSPSLYVVIIAFTLVGFLTGLFVMLRPFFNTRRQLAQERQERAQMAAAPAAQQTDSSPPLSVKEAPPREEPLHATPAPNPDKSDTP